MNIGKAVALFCRIKDKRVPDEEKGQAIFEVLKMPTHNSITKREMMDVIQYLFELAFDAQIDKESGHDNRD